jgi:hypothetical protein
MEENIQIRNRIEGEYLIALLRAAIRSQEAPLPPEGLDWRGVYLLAKKHLVAATVARSVKRTGACPQNVLKKWEESAAAALQKELLFDGERNEILQEFDQAGIRYLPLKGIVIKDFYPRKGMRQFADNDILYDEKRRKDVEKIMLSLGYESKGFSSAHDIYRKPPVFNFELHRRLFDNEQQNRYFNSVWERAVQEKGCAYKMEAEDFYTYLLAHFKKHFSRGGAGLRSFADWYLIRKNVKIENPDYLGACLRATGLTSFEREVTEIAESLFGEGQKVVDKDMLDYIFSSGAYGTEEHVAENRTREHGRVGGLLLFLFPPYRSMVARDPILKRLPVLLPFFWAERLIMAPWSKQKRSRAALAVKAFRSGGAQGKNSDKAKGERK